MLAGCGGMRGTFCDLAGAKLNGFVGEEGSAYVLILSMHHAPAQLLVESQKQLDRRLKMQRLNHGLGSLSAVVTQKPAAAGSGSQKQSLLSLRQSLVQHEQQAARQGQRQAPQAHKPPQ